MTENMDTPMALWREYRAASLAYCATLVAVEDRGQDLVLLEAERQAMQRQDEAEAALVKLADGTPESTLVKLALWVECQEDDSTPELAAVHSAYAELKTVTGLDPLAESVAA